MFDNEMFFQNIKSLCEKNSVKITNLEKELGFGAGTIARWGKSADPSLTKVMDVANYLGVTLEELVNGCDNTDDGFIDALVKLTNQGRILWLETHVENIYLDGQSGKCYRGQYDNKYFDIYAIYNNSILFPNDLTFTLHINGVSSKSYYKKKQLLPLWKAVLFSLNENNKPNEVIIEDFKQQIIEFSKKAGE